MSKSGKIIITDTFEEAIHVTNEYAPEHLIIYTKDDDETSFLSPKLPDKIVFDADRCDGSHLKVGDKIRG